MKVRELLKMLHDDGWFEVELHGSHIQLKHATKTGRVTVSNHKGDLPIKTAYSALKQAGLR
jgi:predicted RNA binding protein YcfA (HicA-like mRNA interferase family)